MLLGNIDLGNPVSDSPLNAGLLAWYSPLPSGLWLQNLRRQSVASYSGTPAYSRSGSGLPSLLYGGSNYWTAPGEETALGSSNFTISFASRSGSVFAGLISSSRGTTPGVVGWTTWLSGTDAYITIDTGGAYDQPGVSIPGYPDGTWHRLCWSIVRGSTATLYMDGVQQGSPQAISSTGSITGSGLTWLGSFAGASSMLVGALADVRIYNRALSADNVWVEHEQCRRGHPDTLRRFSRRHFIVHGAPVTGNRRRRLLITAGGSC